MNLYLQGLTLSVFGMGLTFLALGLLIVAMIALERFFRDGEPAEEEEVPVEEAVPQDDEAEIAAVIAVALNYWRSKSQSSLGAGLEAGYSPWWTVGRARQNPAEALQNVRGRIR
ncbi:MAG: hypothetical protein D6784_10095 [Chloroflexi bacterium]|nr:MAG: hypothetical protein D6784_10095 [Chloroflexota bacterium]